MTVQQDSFAHDQTKTATKMKFAGDSPKGSAAANQRECGLTNGFESVRQGVDEQLVILWCPEMLAHALTWINPARLGLSCWMRSISFRYSA